jgi:hypothetical protein
MKVKFSNWLYILIGVSLATARAEAVPDDNQFEDSRLLFVFNQPAFAPGDTAYFTGYLLQERDQPERNKQIVSIKLLGLSNELIYHGRVLFQDGKGVSQIIIPPDIEPGNYQFVSYIEKSPWVYISYLTILSKDILRTDDLRATHLEDDTTRLKILTDQDKYGRRSKVSVSINPLVSASKSSLTAVSIAVYNEQLFMDSASHKVRSTMLPVRIKSEIPADGLKEVFDLPDYFRGKAFIKSSGMNVPDSSKITFYLNENDFAYVVYTSSGGNFSFPLFKNFGNEEVFYRITYKGDLLRDSQIKLRDEPVNAGVIKSRRSDTLKAYGLYAKQKQFINKSYHYFASKGKNNEAENEFDSDIEADNEVVMDKFESFSSMADIFSNVIPSVRYRKSEGGDRLRIFLQQDAKYGDDDPIYIVDGFMTDNTKYVLNLDPGMVRKISVLRSEITLSRFGDLGRDGILLIETDQVNTRDSLSNSGNSLSVTGISKALDYKKIMYGQSNLSSRAPDLRSSLYWNPKADWTNMQAFDFYTSDDMGYYIIQLAGLVDGEPFLLIKRFYVTH